MNDLSLLNINLPIYEKPIYEPHLGLLSLAAYVEQNNFSVKIKEIIYPYDINVNSNFVGIGVFTPQFNVVKNIIEKIRKQSPNSKIILGGPHVSALPKESFETLKPDYIIVGNGEEQLVNIISGRTNKKILLGTNLGINTLPLPARHLVDLNFYPIKIKGIQATNMITSKGCPFNCYFCSKDREIKYQYRNEELVSKEIEGISQRYRIKAISFHDDIFTMYTERLKKICETLKRENITWRCFSRTDNVSEEIFQTIRDNGCYEVCFGIESGSDRLLKLINKRTTRQHNIDAIKTAKKVGLSVNVNLMVGLPTETQEDIELTKSLLEETDPDDWRLATFVPFPGSYFWYHAKEYGIIIDLDFDKYHINNKNAKGGYITSEKTIEYRDDLLYFLRKNIKNQYN